MALLTALKLAMAGIKPLKPSDYIIAEKPASEPKWTCPIEIPKTRNEVYALFGNPGVGQVDPKWERTNMVVARNLPGTWGKGNLYCHRLAEECIRHALTLAEQRGCLKEIKVLGCFNFRHQRHDPKLPLSYHSWGIAVDINPQDNRGIYRSAEHVDPPFTGNWSQVYPSGVSKELVACFEESGFNWGGRWKEYCDPMHLQLC
jgi:hypothetical protein